MHEYTHTHRDIGARDNQRTTRIYIYIVRIGIKTKATAARIVLYSVFLMCRYRQRVIEWVRESERECVRACIYLQTVWFCVRYTKLATGNRVGICCVYDFYRYVTGFGACVLSTVRFKMTEPVQTSQQVQSNFSVLIRCNEQLCLANNYASHKFTTTPMEQVRANNTNKLRAHTRTAPPFHTRITIFNLFINFASIICTRSFWFARARLCVTTNVSHTNHRHYHHSKLTWQRFLNFYASFVPYLAPFKCVDDFSIRPHRFIRVILLSAMRKASTAHCEW